jgi:hypothetical protein
MTANALFLVAAMCLSTPGAQAVESPPGASPVELDLRRLHVATPSGNRVAPEVEALRGQRVRVAGFMVRMEEAPRGGFYLAPRPVACDESGGGIGDLPPSALRVKLASAPGAPVTWVDGRIELVGTLEVGREEDEDGHVTFVRVSLASPAPASDVP